MTADDDAFIRTIVDNPGHDLPRLVYADWLDDRDDPRGPFLRAEVEWAQPWKDGKIPGGGSELREPAAGLDPLWVARVARPPMGVCADHVGFTESGPQLNSQLLDEVGIRLGVPLPVELRALLLNWNGGVFRLNRFPHPLISNFECVLQPLFSVGGYRYCPADRDLVVDSLEYQRKACPVRSRLVPICAADEGYYELIGVGISGNLRDQVFHVLCDVLSEFAPDPVVVSPTLGTFLARLTLGPPPTTHHQTYS